MKNKKRNKVTLLGTVVVVAIVVGIVAYISRYKSLLPCSETSISYIEIMNGNTGESIRLNDEQQSKIVSIMRGVTCTRIITEPRIGWSYGVHIYADKHGPYVFYTTGHDEVSMDGKKYRVDPDVVKKLNDLCEGCYQKQVASGNMC